MGSPAGHRNQQPSAWPIGMQPGRTIDADALLAARPEPIAAITNAIASRFLTLTSSLPRESGPLPLANDESASRPGAHVRNRATFACGY